MLPLEYCVGGFKCATCGCDLASSQLHFMGTLNAFFWFPLFLSTLRLQSLASSLFSLIGNTALVISFFVNTPLPLQHGQYSLSLFCTEARTAFFFHYIILQDWYSAVLNGRKKPKLLERPQMKGHGTRLINSYDARVRWLSLYAVYTGVCSCKYLMTFWPH